MAQTLAETDRLVFVERNGQDKAELGEAPRSVYKLIPRDTRDEQND